MSNRNAEVASKRAPKEAIRNVTSLIFISHANPEDNLFAAWLAAKLSFFGYQVWCDTTSLEGGTPNLWEEIEKAIRTRAAKFVFVISKDSIKKTGPLRELAIADGLRKPDKEFILPVRVDGTDFGTEMPAALITRFMFDFSGGWEQGLRKVLKKLDGEVPRSEAQNGATAIRFWQERLGKPQSRFKRRRETYWTNWYRVSLPKRTFLYESLPVGTEALYPAGKAGRYLLAFASPADYAGEKVGGYFDLGVSKRPVELETSMIMNEAIPKGKEGLPTAFDCRRALVELMNICFEKLMLAKGFIRFEFSGRIAGWYRKNGARVSMKPFGRKPRQLSGVLGDLSWHYAISADAFLFPFPAYAISAHVVFTKDGTILPQERQHAARRHVARAWFNNKWRDLLLSTMLWIAGGDRNTPTKIQVGSDMYVSIEATPYELETEFGYIEPPKEAQIEE